MELINKKDVLKCFRTTLLLPSDVDVQPIMLWYDQIIGNIKSLPIIESRPKGSFEYLGETKRSTYGDMYQCSNCHFVTISIGNYSMDYCPSCGADMRGEE